MIDASVIIATLHRPQILKNCLEALMIQQGGVSFEIIVVSDGIDEATFKLISDLQSTHKIIHIALPNQKGPAAARNAGAHLARGKLIVFTDDDTLPQSDWLHSFWKACQNHPEEAVALTGMTIVPHGKECTDYEKNISGLEAAEFITANCAVSKSAFNIIGGFDESFTMAWREDSDLHFRLIEKNIPVIKVPEAVVYHPVRHAPWGITMRLEKKNMFNVLLFKKHPKLYLKKIGMHTRWNYYAIVLSAILGVLFAFLQQWVWVVSFMSIALIFIFIFTMQRLSGTSRKPRHVAEMLVTSACIPFASVYWKIYGSIKFKKVFL